MLFGSLISSCSRPFSFIFSITRAILSFCFAVNFSFIISSSLYIMTLPL